MKRTEHLPPRAHPLTFPLRMQASVREGEFQPHTAVFRARNGRSPHDKICLARTSPAFICKKREAFINYNAFHALHIKCIFKKTRLSTEEDPWKASFLLVICLYCSLVSLLSELFEAFKYRQFGARCDQRGYGDTARANGVDIGAWIGSGVLLYIP